MAYLEANNDRVRILRDLNVTGGVLCTALLNESNSQSAISVPPVSKPFIQAQQGASYAATVTPAVRFPPNNLGALTTEIYDTDYGRGAYTVTASSSVAADPYHIFDGQYTGYYWRSSSTYSSGLASASVSTTNVDGASTVNGEWVTLKSPSPFPLHSYSFMTSASSTVYPTRWSILGSLDGINWTTVHSVSNAIVSPNVPQIETVLSNTTFIYYRYVVREIYNWPSLSYTWLDSLIFYSTQVSDLYFDANVVATTVIDPGDYPTNESLNGVYKISSYIPFELRVFNTSSFPNFVPRQNVQGILDDSVALTWDTCELYYSSQSDGSTPSSIIIESPVAFNLQSYAITHTELAYEAPSKWNVYNSTNGIDWVLIDSRVGEIIWASTKRTFSINSAVTSSRYHKIEVMRSAADLLIGSITENVTARTAMDANLFGVGDSTLIESLLGVSLVSSGSGKNTFGFKTLDSGKYLNFNGYMTKRYIQLLPIPLGSNAVVTIYTIRGTGSNGGNAPTTTNEGLIVEFSVDNGTTYFTAGTIAPTTMQADWQIMSLALPTTAASANTFLRISQYNIDGNDDNYGIQYINVSGLSDYVCLKSNSITSLLENPSNLVTVGTGALVNSLSSVVLVASGIGSGATDDFISSDLGKHFRFSGSTTTRYIQLNPLSLFGFTQISIYVIRGTGTNGGAAPNATNEGLYIEFSLDGSTYTSAGVIAEYNMTTGWNTKTLQLPTTASSSNTTLRIIQYNADTTTDNFGIQTITINRIARDPYKNKISISKLKLFTSKANDNDLAFFSDNTFHFGGNIGIGTTVKQDGYAATIHNSSLKLTSTFDKPAITFSGHKGELRPLLATPFLPFSGTTYVSSGKLVPFPPDYFTTSSSTLFLTTLYGTGTYVVTASGQSSSTYAPQYAFDNTATPWRTPALFHGTTGYTGAQATVTTDAGTINGEWIQLQTPNMQILTRYDIASSTTSTTHPKTWYLVGSTDGTTWTTINGQSNITWSVSEYKSFSFSSTSAYNRYRLIVTAKSGTSTTLESVYINSIQFFSLQNLNIQIPKAIDAKTLTNNSPTSLSYIIETNVGVSIDTAAVPVTASLTSLIGLLDSGSTQIWESKETLYTAASDGIAANIIVKMPTQSQLLSYSFTSSSSKTESPSKWNVYGSHDKIGWTLLESKSNIVWNSQFETRLFESIKSTIEYLYHRFEFLRNNASTPTQLSLSKISIYVDNERNTSLYVNESGLKVICDNTNSDGSYGLSVSNSLKSQAIVFGAANDSDYVFIQGINGSSNANLILAAEGGVNNYVGVGTTKPTANLHVNGTSVFNGTSQFSGEITSASITCSDNNILGRLRFGLSTTMPMYQSYITSISTIEQPNYFRFVVIEMWGGGGGGGSGGIQATVGTGVGTAMGGGGGGGGGAYGIITLPYEVASLGMLSVDEVGLGGDGGLPGYLSGAITTTLSASGNAGSAGGQTTVTFSSLYYSCAWTVTGGRGGGAGTSGAGAAGAGATSASPATSATFTTYAVGTAGGAGGTTGAGGNGVNVTVPATSYAASGGGGGGGVPANATTSFYNGGNSGAVAKPLSILTSTPATIFAAGSKATGSTLTTSAELGVGVSSTGSGGTGGGGGLGVVNLSYAETSPSVGGEFGGGGGGAGAFKLTGYVAADYVNGLMTAGGGMGSSGAVRITYH